MKSLCHLWKLSLVPGQHNKQSKGRSSLTMAMTPRTLRTSIALASVLFIALLTTSLRFRSTSLYEHTSLFGQGLITSIDNDYEDGYHDVGSGRKSEVFAEFPDWNVMTNGNVPGSSASQSTYCNTWCMLKQSLGLTIVGLLLICIRLVLR